MRGTRHPDHNISQAMAHHGRTRLGLSLLFVCIVALTYAAVSLVGHSNAAQDLSEKLQLRQWERSNGRYAFHPLSIDSGDYLLLRELPAMNLGRGGAVFIGSSTLQHAVVPWELPPAQRPYIHNLAVESANMMEQYYWVRYLVEHRQLAAAGPGKMMVVLGLSHLDVRDKLPGTRDSKFVDQLFSRHGLFDYDPRHGIEPKPLSQAERFVILEKMRDRGVLLQLGNDVRDELLAHLPWARRGPAPRPDADQAAMDLQMVLMGGSDRWQSAVEHQVGYLSMTIDYLRQHQISVAAVLLPMKRFNDRQPFAAAFHDAVRRLCLEKQVPLTDYSRSMPDSEFADATHLNYVGQHKLSPMMLAPAVDHLKRVGLIP